MRINKIDKFAYLGVAMAAIAALAGCSRGSATAAATSQLEETAITVDSVPVAEESGLYVAAAVALPLEQPASAAIAAMATPRYANLSILLMRIAQDPLLSGD